MTIKSLESWKKNLNQLHLAKTCRADLAYDQKQVGNFVNTAKYQANTTTQDII